jgi:glutamine synthetase type III
MTVRRHDQIYALGRDSGPAQVRLEPGKAAEGWAEFLTKAGIDKDTLPSGVDNAAQFELLKTLTAAISDFQKSIASLDKVLAHHAEGDAYEHAKYMRDKVLPVMVETRKLGDKLETLVDDALWPLPTYREMLFIK